MTRVAYYGYPEGVPGVYKSSRLSGWTPPHPVMGTYTSHGKATISIPLMVV